MDIVTFGKEARLAENGKAVYLCGKALNSEYFGMFPGDKTGLHWHLLIPYVKGELCSVLSVFGS